MAKDYRKLWKDVGNATDEAEAVRALAEIVVDKKGRAFALTLNCTEAELCVETLDYVSRDLRLPTRSAISDGLARASQRRSSKPPPRGALSFSL